VKIELIYVHDCPNAMDYLPELEALLRSVGAHKSGHRHADRWTGKALRRADRHVLFAY
jgi:hypothetical protein